MIDKQQALEIIDKRDFFNDRAGRELWNDKPKEIQDEDIRNAHEEYEQLKEYVLNQPKVGEWIPAEERLPEEPEQNPKLDDRPMELYLVDNGEGSPFRAFWNGKYFHDGWRRLDVLAWMPLPEPFKGD